MKTKHPWWMLGRSGRIAIILLLVLIAVWLVVRRNHDTSSERAQSLSTSPQRSGNHPPAAVPQSSSSNTSNSSGSTALSQAAAKNLSGPVDKTIMLQQLKSWIRKREGHDVEILTTQDVCDLDGNGKSLNVIVTERLNGELTKQQLKDQLSEVTVREHALGEQLAKARQDGDIAGVNRLVAELVEDRTAFVTNNKVSSYKLSLIKTLPPVLAFWPGMPFETVREESARSLAETKLGAGVVLQGLVHYTSATALLHFSDNAGANVYIDPFRMTEVALNTLQNLQQGGSQRHDNGKESRIAAQWTEYLQP